MGKRLKKLRGEEEEEMEFENGRIGKWEEKIEDSEGKKLKEGREKMKNGGMMNRWENEEEKGLDDDEENGVWVGIDIDEERRKWVGWEGEGRKREVEMFGKR